MAGSKRRVRGVTSVRKLLAQAPEGVREELIVELNRGGREIVGRQIAKAPSKTGRLRRGISFKVWPRTLRMQAGIIGPKRERKRLFYAWILERGRAAKEVIATRAGSYGRLLKTGSSARSNSYKNAALNAGVRGVYRMRIRPIKGKWFIKGSSRDLRAIMQRNTKDIWLRGLRRFRGGSDD